MNAIKTLFIWLLMSLVPLQGMAANALLVCKAANQAPAAVHAMQADEAHAHPCDGMQVSQGDNRDNQQGGDSNCAAHYATVPWMAPRELRLPSLPVLPAVVSYPGFHLPSVIPDGPERPPRAHFL